MSVRCAVGLVVLDLLVVGCRPDPAAAESNPSVEAAPSDAPRTAPTAKEQLPIPQAVAKLHQSAFEPNPAEARLGRVLCLVTLHDAAFESGEFYPLVLFAGGFVGTWRQTRAGSEEPFYAKLAPEEQARASELVEAIPAERALARETFDASMLVMGVSTRVNEHVDTLWFENRRSPPALSQLVSLLKQRLEETNRGA